VLSWSPAHEAGLEEKDVLVEFGGQVIRNLRDLRNLIRSRKPGDQVKILVLRRGQLVEMTARLDRRSAQ
ncbi:MAG: PDZ domain-containing protein, partial [Candidatus Aminicenantes bacterium]|nr:PDZ domain-containing protein [Candidatus Aminicenantes bacterium]